MVNARESRKLAVGVVAALLVGLLLAGCETLNGSSQKAAMTPEGQEAHVGKRFQARWDALVAKDYAKVYTFLSPATRALVSEERHNEHYSKSDFEKAELLNVKCEDDTCEVRFMLTYNHAVMKGIVTPTGERWFFRDGEAWFDMSQ